MKSLAATVLLVFLVPPSGLSPQAASISGNGQATHEEIQLSPAVAEKLLIHKVDPKCAPSMARVTGTVVVHIGIGTHGEVQQPKVISGPKMFEPSALDAVRRYKYKPYEVNGKPVEVTTSVFIHYDLSNCP